MVLLTSPILNNLILFIIKAFRSSPVPSLLAEANEPSLYNRRIKFAMQYITKLCWNPSNPSYSCVFNPVFSDHDEKKPLRLSLHLDCKCVGTNILPSYLEVVLTQLRIGHTSLTSLFFYWNQNLDQSLCHVSVHWLWSTYSQSV